MSLRWLSVRMVRAVLCVLFCIFPAFGEAVPENARILLIHSYHQGFEWTDSITWGVADGFKKEFGTLCVEYMDSKNHEPAAVTASFRELLELKYRAAPPDVILCSDNNALAFLVENRAELFPNVPIVFCGINNYSAGMLAGETNITGIIEEPSYGETAELAMEISPAARRIYVVACSAATSEIHIERFINSVSNIDDSVEIVPLHDLTLQEFSDALDQVSKDDIVVNLALHRTSDNKLLSTHEAYSFIRARTEAPIYNLWSAYLPDHSEFIMGGVMVDGRVQGRMMAETALKILDGIPVSRLPILTDSPNVPIINYKELERLGLAHRPLPENVTVINRPFSFYATYRPLVWGVAVVIAGMSTLILFLGLTIRKRRRVEAALRAQGIVLREREEKLRVTLDSLAEAVITADIDGRVRQLNSVAEELTGWSAAKAQGRPIGEVFRMQDAATHEPLADPVEEVKARGGLTIRANHVLLAAWNRAECRIAGSGAPIRDDQGRTVGVVLVFRDITEELILQEKLQHGQKMDAVGQLAGGVAHDFNNMLGGIIAAAEMVQIELQQEKDPSELLEMILSSADRAASLTQKLLAFARKQPFESEPLEINEPIREALALFSHTADKRIRVHADLPEDHLRVSGDFSLLQSVFLNLFINASHAMPAGGDLYISLRTVELDEEYCGMSVFDLQPGPFVEVEIRDTGEGIPGALLTRIFEPFFTTKGIGKGTGLGLAAVMGTVQQHGGSITVYSELEIGTSFHITLPLTDRPARPAEETGSEDLSGSGTILVVDDEKIMRETCRAILEDLGYDVLLAEDGVQGLEQFKKEQSRIDLIILDMVMPEMNGRDCFLAVRAVSRDVRIIISSGFSRIEELKKLQEQGLNGVIHKPFRRSELGRMVQAVLKKENE